MSSTNSTSHYELSQFVGSDKPAWLGDYNSDMSKIDTGIYNAQSTATGADGKADTNAGAIGTLANLTTDAKNNLVAAINEVDGHADTAQGTANDAATNASTALTQISKFNLTSTSNLAPSVNIGTLDASTYVRFATDSSSSIFKLYGRVQVYVANAGAGTLTIKIGETSLRPTQDYVIESAGYLHIARKDGQPSVGIPVNISIKTNGDIYIEETFSDPANTYNTLLFWFPPCIYFNTNFGD